MNRKASQCQKILEYIKKHGSISPKEAFYHFGCMRLAARIADLEKVGHAFTHQLIVQQTDAGTERYMRYGRT